MDFIEGSRAIDQMNKKIMLISRDKRVHDLFRKNWVSALIDCGYEVHPKFRSELLQTKLVLELIYSKLAGYKIFVFGASEALLFAFFRPDLVIITGLGRLLMPVNKFRKFYFNLLKKFFSKTNLVVLNQSDYRLFKSMGFEFVHKINGEGVDIEKFHQDVANKISKIENTPIRLAYVGRLLRSKKVDVLINYFEKIQSYSDKKFEFVLVGDADFGNSDAVASELIEGFIHRNPDSVKVTGFIDDTANLLKDIDIFVNLSEREGLPFSVVEALSAGCNCILSNVPGNQEFKYLDCVILVKNEAEFMAAVDKFTDCTYLRNVPDIEKFSSKKVKEDIVLLATHIF